jgi:hypothetical protein
VVHFSGSPSLLGIVEFIVPTGSFFQLILTFGDFGIAELFLLNKKWLLKRQHNKVCIS